MFSFIPDGILCQQGAKSYEDVDMVLRSPHLRFQASRLSYPQEQIAFDPDDPLTQVSRIRTPDGYISSSPRISRFVSPEIFTPSPPPIRRLSSAATQYSVSPPPLMASPIDPQPLADAFQEQPAPPENFVRQEEESTVIPFEPAVKSTFTKTDIVNFVNEIKKQLHREEPLTTCARFVRRRACRFELPPYMKSLEGLTPLSYIIKHCAVDSLKRDSYKKAYKKVCKANLETTLKPQYLPVAFFEIFHRSVPEHHMETLRSLVEWEENVPFDEKTFVSVCGLMERILAQDNKNTPLEIIDQKNDIECADFSALNLKLKGVKVSPELIRLLEYVLNS